MIYAAILVSIRIRVWRVFRLIVNSITIAIVASDRFQRCYDKAIQIKWSLVFGVYDKQ